MTIPLKSLPVGARWRAMPFALMRSQSQSIARERAPKGHSTMSAE